ncbi:MAG: CHASE2 domain-containing protein [Bacteroidota bacterium]
MKFSIKDGKGQLKLWIDGILATAFIFFMIFGIFSLSAFRIFDVLDPVGDALSDFEFTDYVFSQLRTEPPADTNVVLVNFGPPEGGRGLIAEVVRIVGKYDPAAVGIDSFFPVLKEEDPVADSLLSKVLSNIDNLVMVSRVEGYDESTDTFEEFFYSHDTFLINAKTAIANLETNAAHQEDMKVVRRFPPKRTVNGLEEIAFGAQLASYIAPKKVEKFLGRDNEYEVINFRGNIVDPYQAGAAQYGGRFFALDYVDILTENFTEDLLKDKIVIIGYLGNNLFDTSWDDKFYTPINKKPAGRANPDMYGPVVHANIAAMILNEDYVGNMSQEQGVIFAIILCFINVLLFLQIYRKLPKWYDGITKVIQLIEALLIVLIIVYAFHVFSLKLDLTLAIVAILLSGDLIEVYNGVLKNLFNKEQRRLLFKPRSN